MTKVLPIGSVVKLNITNSEFSDTLFVVIKRFVTNPKNRNEYFEYEVMLYPAGTTDGKNLMLNREQISEVVHHGYSDIKDEECQQLIMSTIEKNQIKKVIIER